jgi:poly(3-hydroxybutyrate) depolymerase
MNHRMKLSSGAAKRLVGLVMACFAVAGLSGLLILAQEPAAPKSDSIELSEFLLIGRVTSQGRTPVHTDAVEAQIIAGRWVAPKEGDSVTLPDGTSRSWQKGGAGQDGVLNSQAWSGGYAYAHVEAPTPRAMVLEASGHGMVYVNGEPRAGDPYSNNYVRLPVVLRQGANDFLFAYGRGRLKARLVAPRSGVSLGNADATLPDLVAGEKVQTWGAVIVINASAAPAGQLSLSASYGATPPVSTPLPIIPPYSMRKVGFQLSGPPAAATEKCPLELKLSGKEGARLLALDAVSLSLRVRQKDQTRKQAFVSRIDGSVQYFAVNPIMPAGTSPSASIAARGPALFLSLHGAGVEAIGQADAYFGKTWGYIVAPTNRRPYGFDWEDWGRMDALEVLDLAMQQFRTDPQRTYLTGHSMGGHGTWILGATFPDRFAAIGPSAGWISWATYGGRPVRDSQPSAVQEMLQRAAASSDTLSMLHNYAQQGVYILHGGADDNVPVAQARTMNQNLGAFHRDFVFHEQPGAGHWWDDSDEPGAACVDWPAMFDFFARHALPEDAAVRQVEFVTINPGVSAWSHWAGIEAQLAPLKPSSVNIRFDPGRRLFAGVTENVARLSFRLGHVQAGKPLQLALDGQRLPDVPWPAGAPQIWLQHSGGTWTVTGPPAPSMKGPLRSGPFKEGMRNRILLVYGTHGSPEENAWAAAKARFDAEQFWYRGNGSLETLADEQFQAGADPDRDVVLYGNSQTNSAWTRLLAGSPVQAHPGSIRIGPRDEQGGDLACLFLRPRPGSASASVMVVGGTGIAGMRLTDRLPYFTSGVAYPDFIVLSPDVLTQGNAGIRAAGFFGPDWGVESGESAWRK